MNAQFSQPAQTVTNKRSYLNLIPKIIIAVAAILILGGIIVGFINYRQTSSWAGAHSVLTPVFIVSEVFGGIFLLVGLYLSFAWKRESAAAAEILAGKDVLAHWSYQPEMSEQFGANEMARLKWQIYLIKLPLVAAGLGVIGWLGTGIHTVRMFLLSIGIGALAGLFLGLLSWLIAYVQAANTRKQAIGDVYITRQGVLLGDGTYHHWEGSNRRLTSVAYEATNPAVLQFNYFIGTSSILSSISTATLIADAASGGEIGYRTNLAAQTFRVPVPPGKEQEAQRLAAMFSELK